MASVKSVEPPFDIVPTRLAVKAMRDSGYKNAAYAIAELVDNAIQAKASQIEILCKEEEELVSQRVRRRVKEIAVIDNGTGMDAEVLRKALQFGNGERLDDRSGIGRFGMGLPNSSVSQARRVDVWSWQAPKGEVLHTYLDLDEVETGDLREVPEPSRKAAPKEWAKYSDVIGRSKSGTLVVWSTLDKCDWKTAHAIFKNSEFTIGRIYRRFLHDGRVRIRMAAFVPGATELHFDQDARANDPMYLMTDTSCPAPWDKEPMFEPYGEASELKYKVKGKTHKVIVRFSLARKAARSGHNPGGLPHGKHASNNIGVSVVRADRELELQTSGWTVSYNPVERWWGVEVEFPPDLDELFGVTNNKQHARALAEFAEHDLDQIALREGYDSEQALREAWQDEGDPRMLLVQVKALIESNLETIRRSLTAQTARSRGGKKRHPDENSAEDRGTKATQQRKEDGHAGTSDRDEQRPADEKEAGLAKDYEQQGLDPDEARERAANVVAHGRKYDFVEVDLTTPEFFTVRIKSGAIIIGLNTAHPAYQHLVALLKQEDDTDDIDELKRRMQRSYEGLKLLLEAWARYEDEQTDGKRKEQAQTARLDWGRVARDFFRDE